MLPFLYHINFFSLRSVLFNDAFYVRSWLFSLTVILISLSCRLCLSYDNKPEFQKKKKTHGKDFSPIISFNLLSLLALKFHKRSIAMFCEQYSV